LSNPIANAGLALNHSLGNRPMLAVHVPRVPMIASKFR
jgi:hypothetical protein